MACSGWQLRRLRSGLPRGVVPIGRGGVGQQAFSQPAHISPPPRGSFLCQLRPGKSACLGQCVGTLLKPLLRRGVKLGLFKWRPNKTVKINKIRNPSTFSQLVGVGVIPNFGTLATFCHRTTLLVVALAPPSNSGLRGAGVHGVHRGRRVTSFVFLRMWLSTRLLRCRLWSFVGFERSCVAQLFTSDSVCREWDCGWRGIPTPFPLFALFPQECAPANKELSNK